MDLAFTPEEQKFAAEVRAFVKANLPADVRDKVKNGKHLIRDDYMRWQQALGKKGWLVYTWPKKYGGPGFTPAQRYIFENICAEEYAPGIIPFGTKMVGPVIYTFGSATSRRPSTCRRSARAPCGGARAIPSRARAPISRSLRTKAEKQGDHYIVNGSKTWNTMGHWADWIFCLVRTDPKAKPQEGISFLLIDMKTPGITVKPIIMMDGGHEVNEVFFDNVKVPVANLVGKENEGWTCAKFLLANERLGIAAVPQSKRGVEALEGHRPRRAGQRQAADREPELRREDRRSRDPGDGARIHRAARAVADGAGRPARAGSVGAEDPRLGDPAAHHRAHHGSGRRIFGAVPARPAVAGHQRGAGRAGVRAPRRAALLQQPQDHDLRRQQRDPEGHHLARWCWGCDDHPSSRAKPRTSSRRHQKALGFARGTE